MRRWIAVVLLMGIGVPAATAQVEPRRAASAQAEEVIQASETTNGGETVTTTTSTTTITMTLPEDDAGVAAPPLSAPPKWLPLVRLAAGAGPIAFLLLAWAIGALVHVRLVKREQEQFPIMRGSRAPQTTPMLISAALFFVPAVLFVFFEIRSRQELRAGSGGIVDEWLPVTTQAWIALLVCLVLALLPWLFARRADTVAEGRN